MFSQVHLVMLSRSALMFSAVGATLLAMVAAGGPAAI